MNWDSRDGDPLDDAEGPQDIDLGDDDSADYEAVPCPSCGADVSELAEQCPHCGDWITPSAGPARRGPWIITLAIALLIAFVLWIL